MPKTKKELTAELKALKESNPGQIFKLTTYIDEDEKKERTLFLKKPSRLTRTAGEKQAQANTWKGLEVFLRGMYIGGDDLEEIFKNDDALMTAGEQLAEIIKVKSGNVERV